MLSLNEIDILWITISAFLVFLMQLGFSMIEASTVRAKNTISVAMKNLIDTIFGMIFFWLVGYGLMYGEDYGGLFGTTSFAIDGNNFKENAFFFFHVMFAATAVTIVSGAVAERMKFHGYILTSIMVITFLYPVFGHWAWSDHGWLKSIGFVDFAGSTVVHSIGAWVGLAGAIMLGPRLGKFHKGKTTYFPPSNHNILVFGTFILWFSWFGFNAGSLLHYDISITKILLNTSIAAAFGGLSAFIITLFHKERIGVEVFSFGILAGLVGITAGCNDLTTIQSAFVGYVATLIMFAFNQLLLRLKIDDPLSVVSIHGFAGVWGTLAVGFFANLSEGLGRLDFIGVQLLGITSAFLYAFFPSLLFFYLLKKLHLLRVTKRQEVLGLNFSEHNVSLPLMDTINSIMKIKHTGNLNIKLPEERHTEIGVISRFFNYLIDSINAKQIVMKEQNVELKHTTITDMHTGVLNRRGLIEFANEKNPNDTHYSLIIFDIDHFKEINDSYGHQTGDSVLKEIVELIIPELEQKDLLVRWGGDEFVIILQYNNKYRAEQFAEHLKNKVNTHQFDIVKKVTCSFGVTSPRKESCDCFTLIENADKALYQAKELGRDRVCTW
ncbi:MAG: ammonium transporter [Sulfurovum sp.]|nr:ammonium transporter [Sulfurovum sp.]